MTRPGRPATIAAITLIGAIAMTSCSSDPGSTEAATTRRIDTIWAAAGAEPADATTLGYERFDRPRADACADLPEDDRWWGTRTARLRPGAVDQLDLLDRVGALLTDDGYQVARYRSTGSETRILKASSAEDQTAVELHVTADGGAALRVHAGPCGPRIGMRVDPPYEPERGPSGV